MILVKRFLTLLLFVSSSVYAQSIRDLKPVYDSIMELEVGVRAPLISIFFDKHKNHPDQLQLALCHHEYSKEIYRVDVKKAIKHVNQAISIRQQYKDTLAVSKSLYALGYYNNLVGNYQKSIQAYTSLTAYGMEDNLTAKTYNRLGVVYTKIGDYDNAKSNFIKANNYFRKQGENELLFKNHLELSEMFSEVSWSSKNNDIMYHAQCADSILSIINVSQLDKLRLNQILGNLYDSRQEYDKAIVYHKKALGISSAMQDSVYIAMNYNNMGISYRESNQLVKSILHYNKAIEFAHQQPQVKAIIYNNLGDYYISKQEYQKALMNYQKAITYTLEKKDTLTYIALPDLEELKVSPYKVDLLGYYIDKANAWNTYYANNPDKEYLKQALKTFKMADQLADIIRFESTEFQSKLFWRSQSAELYMKAVQVCYQLNDASAAFYFMEKNKAILLLEDITQEKAKENARLPDQLSEREFELRKAIYLAEEALNDQISNNHSITDSLKDLVYDHKKEYKSFIDSLEMGYPEYYAYKRNLQLISFEEAKMIHENDLTLYYLLNNMDGYGLLLSKSQHHFFKIDNVPLLQKNINELRKKLANPFYTHDEVSAYQKLAFDIYITLFPFKIDSTVGKRLTIIPDHSLQQIPFEVLMNTRAEPNSYLINRYDISYAYSLSFSKVNEKRKRDPKNVFIGFAPVIFTYSSLLTLSKSIEELSKITQQFSGDVYYMAQASKDNFIDHMNEYKIIHLSTHANIGKDTSPWIAFYDDKISLDELYATKNQAELVVLSACNTSIGELKSGEGVMSLARGFFSTGTNSVVSTLWSSNEKSTNEIMTLFYENLKNGDSKTKALQDAKRTYLNNHIGIEASPYYWGALILIGNTNQIATRDHLLWYLLLGAFIVILLYSLQKKYL